VLAGAALMAARASDVKPSPAFAMAETGQL